MMSLYDNTIYLQILKDIHENKLLEAEKELLNARKDSEQKVQRSNEADSRMDKVQETLDRSKFHYFFRIDQITTFNKANRCLQTMAGTELH